MKMIDHKKHQCPMCQVPNCVIERPRLRLWECLNCGHTFESSLHIKHLLKEMTVFEQ